MLELHFQGRSGRLGELLPITKAEIDELSEAAPELVIHLFTTKEKEGRDPRQGYGNLVAFHAPTHVRTLYSVLSLAMLKLILRLVSCQTLL